MPFLTLPPSERSPTSGQTSFNYQISTPSSQIFRNVSNYSTTLRKNSTNESSPHSNGSDSKKMGRSRGLSIVGEGSSALTPSPEVEEQEVSNVLVETNQSLLPTPEKGYPIVLFLGAELVTTINLFRDILVDLNLSSKFNLIALDTRAYGLSIQGKLLPDRRDYKQDDQAFEVLSFLSTLCSSIPSISIPTSQAPKHPLSFEWESGIHLVGVSISGLTCLRMASTPNWIDSIKSIIWSAPVKELESEDIIAAYQGLQEVAALRNPSMPKEIIEGVEFRWCAGASNGCPKRIIRDLKKGWLAITLAEDGPEKAYACLFSPYWTREIFGDQEAERVKAQVVVVEGTQGLPYEKQVGLELKEKLKNSAFSYEEIKNSPWLTPICRPRELTQIIDSTVSGHGSNDSLTSTPTALSMRMEPKFVFPTYLTRTERLHLLSMFHDTDSISQNHSSSSNNKSSKLSIEQGLESMNLTSSSDSRLSSKNLSSIPEGRSSSESWSTFNILGHEEDDQDDSGSEDSFASLDEDVLLSLKRGRIQDGDGKENDQNQDKFSGFYQDLLLEELEETFYDAGDF